MVEEYRGRDECFEKDAGSEDSDDEDGPDQAGNSVAETEVGDEQKPDQSTLPVLSVGTYAR